MRKKVIREGGIDYLLLVTVVQGSSKRCAKPPSMSKYAEETSKNYN